MEGFGERLRSMRQERNLGQIELAKALDVGKSIISLWELDKCEPTLSKLVAMAKYFGSANDIYTLKQAQKQQSKLIKDSLKKTKTLMGKNNPFDDLPWAKNQDVIQIEEKREKKKKYEITGYENAHLYLPKKQEYFI